MAVEKLIVEMGRYTGKQGLEVYERLKNEVDIEWNKLQQEKVKKSRSLRNSKAVMEMIVVKALDGFLSELPAKVRLEKHVTHTISDKQWNEVVGIDRAFPLKVLRTECRNRGLPRTGDKKELAWRLLGYETKVIKKPVT